MITKVLKYRYIKDNLIMMIGTVLGGLLGYFFHFFVARILSVSEYGEMQSVFAFVAVAGIFASGFSYFVIKYSSLFAAEKDYLANAQFIAYLNKKLFGIVAIISLLLFALSPLVKKILHLSDMWGITAGILAVIFSVAAVVFQETLRAWQKFLALTVVGVLAASSKLIFGYGFAVFFGKSSPVVFSLAISTLLGWMIAAYFWKRMKRANLSQIKKNREEYISRKKIWKNAIQIFFFSLMVALVMNADVLLVKNLTTSELTGYYGALSVLGKIVLWLNLSIVSVALPRACADGHRGEQLHSRIFLFSLAMMLTMGGSLILAYFLVPQNIVGLLFGGKYIFVSGNLWLFGLMSLVMSFLKFESDLAFARHDFRINYLLFLTVVVMAAAIFRHHGNLGEIAVWVSASLLLGYFLAAFLNFSNRKRKIIEPII
ncbi:MAG: oligosaccharide flippase family protein [Patescibacteria group bacterium]|nr:oligosaccharide flippase family protein [Patescibacteria group bacterium]